MKRYNNRGEVNWVLVLIVGLIAVLIIVLIIRSWGKSADNNFRTLSNCGSLTGGMGFCRVECKEGELKYQNFGGCPPKDDSGATFCCVNPDKSVSSVLPEEFGGNDAYNFKIKYIGFLYTASEAKPSSCQFVAGSSVKMQCAKGIGITLPIQINIQNVGTQPLDVYGLPMVTINDNYNTMTTPANGNTLTKLAVGGAESSVAKIVIEPSKANGFYRIYGYAKCETQECKNTNPKGVLRKYDDNAYIEVTFT